MPSVTSIQTLRKSAVREIRRRQRTADTEIEKLERRLFQLLDRKTLLDLDDMIDFADRYKRFLGAVKEVERAVNDAMELFRE